MPRVLIVDDDPDIQAMLREILRDEGYEVRVANNGREALDDVARELPDLILLDLMMPVMDGRQFYEAFIARRTMHVPVLLVSAGHGLEQKAVEIGTDGCLPKPFDLDELLHVVERFIRANTAGA